MLAKPHFEFEPLSKEQRFVLTAYTGDFMVLSDETDDFYAFMSDITGRPVKHYLDLLEPSVWILAKAAVTNDFLRLMVPQSVLEADFNEKVGSEILAALNNPDTLTDVQDEVLQELLPGNADFRQNALRQTKRN